MFPWQSKASDERVAAMRAGEQHQAAEHDRAVARIVGQAAHEHCRPPRPADWPVGAKTPAEFEFDLLAEMARYPASGLVQIADGVYVGTSNDRSGCPFCISEKGHYGWNSGPC